MTLQCTVIEVDILYFECLLNFKSPFYKMPRFDENNIIGK